MELEIDCIVSCTIRSETERILQLTALWAQENCVRIRLREAALTDLLEGAAHGALLVVDGGSFAGDAAGQLAQLRQAHPQSGIVLLSDDSQFAIDAYRCHPDGFVDKPLSYRKLSAALARCFASWQAGLMRLDVPVRHKRMQIPLCWVYYAEADGRNTRLHHGDGILNVNCSLREVEAMLPSPPFVRCQKSFVVHLGAVHSFAGGKLVMQDGSEISAARPRIRELQAQLEAYQRLRREEEITHAAVGFDL